MEPKYNVFFLITGVILIGLIVGVTLLAVQANRVNSASEASIDTLNNQVTAVQSSVTSVNAAMTSLTDQVNSAISTMTSDISYNSQEITALTRDLNSITSQLTTLNTQVTSLNARLDDLETASTSASTSITSIQNQLSTISSQITSLQSTTSSLQTSINSLTTRVSALESSYSTKTTTLFTSYSITQDFNTRTLLTTFSPSGTGTLYVSGTSSSATGYIRVYNNTSSTYNDYTFGTGTTISAPVTYGYSYSIYFGNTASSGTVSATLTASYTYSSYSSTTLFTSKSITQNHGDTTIVKTYAPAYTGYFTVTGTSSSSTSYIRIYNNTLSTYTDYAFGTGTTITAPVSAGYSYSIIFGNSASSGTVTATLSGTYFHY